LKYDFTIIGAGIVGLSTAWQLKRRVKRSRVLLLENEAAPSRHQTGHNSGVVHAGVYYEPGSLKARFCREGLRDTHAFCTEHGLPFERPGKLLVATSDVELERLKHLEKRCRENGLQPEWLGAKELRKIEPAVAGIAAIRVSESGITDFPAICRAMLEQFRQAGGEARFGTKVLGIEENDGGVTVSTDDATIHAGRLVACAGLMADRVAEMQGLGRGFRIIPYRGEYYRLRPGLNGLVRHLVYPVPDPALPFLGVHLTPTVSGGITVGPNAVQGWKREGYGRFNFSWRDTSDMLFYPGFWRVASRHFRHGLRETRNSLFKRAYLDEVKKYCPQVEAGDLLPHPAGIRAQAVTRDGELLHDFLIEKTPRSLHVCNAPSPAATSAIPIGRHICDILLDVSS
jgi:L-2-hydroxyglutarate oxidase